MHNLRIWLDEAGLFIRRYSIALLVTALYFGAAAQLTWAFFAYRENEPIGSLVTPLVIALAMVWIAELNARALHHR